MKKKKEDTTCVTQEAQPQDCVHYSKKVYYLVGNLITFTASPSKIYHLHQASFGCLRNQAIRKIFGFALFGRTDEKS